MGETLNCPSCGITRLANGQCPKCSGGGIAVGPKECKGKAAARALAVMVLSPEIGRYLRENDPKALEQALKSLEPFGYPDSDALRQKLGL